MALVLTINGGSSSVKFAPFESGVTATAESRWVGAAVEWA